MRQIGSQEEPGGQHLRQQALLVSSLDVCICRLSLDVSQSSSANALPGVTDKSNVDPKRICRHWYVGSQPMPVRFRRAALSSALIVD